VLRKPSKATPKGTRRPSVALSPIAAVAPPLSVMGGKEHATRLRGTPMAAAKLLWTGLVLRRGMGRQKVCSLCVHAGMALLVLMRTRARRSKVGRSSGHVSALSSKTLKNPLPCNSMLIKAGLQCKRVTGGGAKQGIDSKRVPRGDAGRCKERAPNSQVRCGWELMTSPEAPREYLDMR
jgi:hypothetical protein